MRQSATEAVGSVAPTRIDFRHHRIYHQLRCCSLRVVPFDGMEHRLQEVIASSTISQWRRRQDRYISIPLRLRSRYVELLDLRLHRRCECWWGAPNNVQRGQRRKDLDASGGSTVGCIGHRPGLQLVESDSRCCLEGGDE